MTKLDEVLAATRSEGRAALVGYLPAGFPSREGCLRAVRTMVEAGCDIVEVGLPYTDPLMDGPVIQTAATQALEQGVHVPDVFAAVREVSDAGGAAVVMTYWNPVLRHGVREFAQDLAAAGGSGLITPDLVPEEGADWIEVADELGLAKIFLVAPSSTPARIAATTNVTSGFVYAASVMGVTGARTSVGEAAKGLVEKVRATTDLPVCVGLGVSTGEQAREIGQYADGVIVGSALVKCLLDVDLDEGLERLAEKTRELAAGVRG
ncbi:tryptophan synthase subunit alpha [Dermacoccus abyssi]|jgi:tryptophan synthase alpha chain|uniref:Tryptophan synthase alpha chain n=1 Tax=Dermacoccus abyssi TaxID=322596 RepID=A0ABX5ZC65_9MICO|nr:MULTISPECIES: tryptophan synthase subunit alpha [Dermacoccus]MBE7372560.1 tryptophan synthase subunit alpha [Dermacoccus barathri]MCT1985740.1 tryptophan synthase subunit alpha [Dermacoccus abyssi]QEH93359.1 tryptophan synthase subunit alpha [Dermacoccus abyssi]